MKKFKLKYYYLATGMEGVPQEYPEKIIYAKDIDEAFYKYHTSNGINFGTFEEFMQKEEYVRTWATTCVEITETENKESMKFTLEDIIDAVQYGFDYRIESMNDGKSVPIGNVLQHLMWRKNFKEVPEEFKKYK